MTLQTTNQFNQSTKLVSRIKYLSEVIKNAVANNKHSLTLLLLKDEKESSRSTVSKHKSETMFVVSIRSSRLVVILEELVKAFIEHNVGR